MQNPEVGKEAAIVGTLLRNLLDFEFFMWDVLPQMSDEEKEVFCSYVGFVPSSCVKYDEDE